MDGWKREHTPGMMKEQRKRSLREVWGERFRRGLEVVLEEINEMIRNGECDIAEFALVQKEDAFKQQKETFNDQEEQAHGLQEKILDQVRQLVRAGVSDIDTIYAEVVRKYSHRQETHASSIRHALEVVLAELDQDESYLQEEAERVRNKAVLGYSAEMFQSLWRRYQFRQRLKNSKTWLLQTALPRFQRRVKAVLYCKKLKAVAEASEKETSALRIQFAFRRYRIRCYNHAVQQVWEARRRRLQETVSARKIQTFWRGFFVKFSAARKLQSHIRRRIALARFRANKMQRCRDIIAPMVKKRVNELQYYNNCVKKIQRFWRRMRQAIALHERLRAASVRKLSTWWRNTKDVRKPKAATQLQRLVRGFLARQTRKRFVLSVNKIASIFRARQARKLASTLRAKRLLHLQRQEIRLKENSAAMTVTTWARQILAKKLVRKIRELREKEKLEKQRQRQRQEQERQREKKEQMEKQEKQRQRQREEQERQRQKKEQEKEKKKVEDEKMQIQADPAVHEDEVPSREEFSQFSSGRLYGRKGSKFGTQSQQHQRQPSLPPLQRVPKLARSFLEKLEQDSQRTESSRCDVPSKPVKQRKVPNNRAKHSFRKIVAPLPSDNYRWSYSNQLKSHTHRPSLPKL